MTYAITMKDTAKGSVILRVVKNLMSYPALVSFYNTFTNFSASNFFRDL